MAINEGGKMKIRIGFVSNSSSSSYIIAYKKATACPTCGHTPSDFLAAVASRRYDDNRVCWTEPTAKMEEIEEEIAAQQKEAARLEKLDPKGKEKEYYRSNADCLQWVNERIQELFKLRQLIKDHRLQGHVVAEVEIRHHDDLNDRMREMEKNKELFILEVSE